MSGDDSSGSLDDRLGNSLFGGDARSADYQAWAERLRAKRDRSKQQVADCIDGPAAATGSDYWSTDALFAESARVQANEQAVTASRWEAEERKVELARDLGMHGDINVSTASEAYRRLAKLHHPDRYVASDPSTRDHHAAEMIRINSAYRSLKKLLAEG